jgi:PAS domain S-box-containing protein
MNSHSVKSIPDLPNTAPPFFTTSIDELSSSEQFLLSMYDSVQTSIFIVDVLDNGDFCYLALNPTHERCLGLRSEEVRGKRPEDILSPLDAVRVRQRYTDCVQFGQTMSYEQCLHFQGIRTWWSTTLTPLRDHQGRIYQLIGTSKNITHLKQAELAGRIQAEREQLLKDTANSICQGEELGVTIQQTVLELRQMLECDRLMIYHLVTQESGEIIAESTLKPEISLLGQKINAPCFLTEHQEHYKQGSIHVIEDIAATGLHPGQRDFLAAIQVRANLVVPIIQQQDLWGLLIAQYCWEPHQWQQSEIDLCKQIALQLGIAILQSQLQQQVQHLQSQLELQTQEHHRQLQQQQEFQALLSKITEKICDRWDVQQIFHVVTQELAELLQVERCYIELYDSEKTTTTVSSDYCPDADYHQESSKQILDYPHIYQQLLQKQPWQCAEIMAGCKPTLKFVSQLACPIFDAQGIFGNIWLIRTKEEKFSPSEIGLVEDIANECAIAIRQSQLYAQTTAQDRELEQRERSKHEFLKNLSQELRTPLTSISLVAQTLEGVLTPNGIIDLDLVPQLLQILHNECGRENNLINDLLTLASLKIEPDPPIFIEIELPTWLPPIVESFRDVANCQKQILTFTIAEDIPSFQTDITDLDRIITALINHACQCTPANEFIQISASGNEKLIEIKITNSGIEISQSELSQIFQPFHHITKNDPWKSTNTGLELTLVKIMVQRLGGSIYVDSGENLLTFTLQLPIS